MVNRAHPLVKGLLKLSAGALITGSGPSPSQVLSQDLCRHLHELARLGVGGVEPGQMAELQSRSTLIIGRMLEQLT